jgi:regulator of protease activity HflC (stomatin/prohibitin superfamily)
MNTLAILGIIVGLIATTIGVFCLVWKFYGGGWLEKMAEKQRFVAKLPNRTTAAIRRGGVVMCVASNHDGKITFIKKSQGYKNPDEHMLGRFLLGCGFVYLGLAENSKLVETSQGSTVPQQARKSFRVDRIELRGKTSVVCEVSILFGVIGDPTEALLSVNAASMDWLKDVVEQITRDAWEKYDLFEIVLQQKEDEVKKVIVEKIGEEKAKIEKLLGITVEEVRVPKWDYTAPADVTELLDASTKVKAQLEADLEKIAQQINIADANVKLAGAKQREAVANAQAKEKEEEARLLAEKKAWDRFLAEFGGDTDKAKEARLAALMGEINYAALKRQLGLEAFKITPGTSIGGSYAPTVGGTGIEKYTEV